MLAGVATRRHARVAEPVGAQVAEEAKSTSRSAISRRFVRQTETALAELMARDLSGLDIKVLMLDGEHMADRCVVVALAITADGTKEPVGLWDGSTENKTVVALAAGRPGRRAAWPSTTGCWWSSTAPRPWPRRCARCSAPRRSSSDAHCTSGETSPSTCLTRSKAWVDAKLVKAFSHPDPDAGAAQRQTPGRPTGEELPRRGRVAARGAGGDVHRRPPRHRRPARQDPDHESTRSSR